MEMLQNRNVRIKALILLAVLLASTGVVGAYAVLQAQTVALEVKEPLEVLPFDSSLSLYPGETLQFNVAVENHASVSYNASLIFGLNDTNYQQSYVSFSNSVYLIQPGTNTLQAWLSVVSTAPAAQLELSVNVTRDIDALPQPTPSPTPAPTNLNPSLTLFAAGAKWAANGGTSALYINWYDNYCAHHISDPSWGPWWREGQLAEIKNVTVNLLEQQGFKVTCAGDVPNDLAGYDLIIFEAWFAVEPKHTQQVRNYLQSGGNVVVIGGAPCYFATYCKDMWPYKTGGTNLESLSDWFGSSQFVNTGGTANLVVDKPLGTSFEKGNAIYHIDAYGCYSLASMNGEAQVIARWDSGSVYAFTHEYGKGRVFYQAEMSWQ